MKYYFRKEASILLDMSVCDNEGHESVLPVNVTCTTCKLVHVNEKYLNNKVIHVLIHQTQTLYSTK